MAFFIGETTNYRTKSFSRIDPGSKTSELMSIVHRFLIQKNFSKGYTHDQHAVSTLLQKTKKGAEKHLLKNIFLG